MQALMQDRSPPGVLPDGPPAASMVRAPRSFGDAYGSLTISLISRARRELSISLTAQPVFDLTRSCVVGRRIRRSVRHVGGEAALFSLGGRTIETTDLKRIDLETLKHGLDLLHPAAGACSVLPVYWRTVAASGGRFPLVCREVREAEGVADLQVEILGGLEGAPPEAVRETIGQFERAGMEVVCHVAPDPAAALRLKPAGPRCLSIDFAGVAHETAPDWQGAARLIAVARDSAPQVLLLNLRPDRGLAAQAAGATHAVFAGMTPITI